RSVARARVLERDRPRARREPRRRAPGGPRQRGAVPAPPDRERADDQAHARAALPLRSLPGARNPDAFGSARARAGRGGGERWRGGVRRPTKSADAQRGEAERRPEPERERVASAMARQGKEADEVGRRAARRSRAKAGARARASSERDGPAR